jgi:HSP20 family protein
MVAPLAQPRSIKRRVGTMYNHVRVFPGSMIRGTVLEAFEEMWNLIEPVSRFPEGLVCGDFPPMNIMADKDDNLVIQMAIAGYPNDGVDLSYKDDYLTVKLTPEEKSLDEYKVKMKGIRSSKAERKIAVPSKDFNVAKAEATQKNGVLTIKIPRKEEAKPLAITIKQT